MVSCFIIYLVNKYKLMIFIALLCYKAKNKKIKNVQVISSSGKTLASLRFKSKFKCAQV